MVLAELRTVKWDDFVMRGLTCTNCPGSRFLTLNPRGHIYYLNRHCKCAKPAYMAIMDEDYNFERKVGWLP